jgi:hypothetical protein
MNAPNDWAIDDDDDHLVEGWFQQGELGDVPEAAPYEEVGGRRSRAGVVIAAVSATALTLVLVLVGRV